MLHLMKRLFEAGLTVFSVSVLHHAVVLLLLTHHCGGADSVIDPYSVTFVGENQEKDDLYCFTPAVFYSVSSGFLGVTVTLIVVVFRRKKPADLQNRRLRRNSSETTGLSPASTTGLLSATSCSQRRDDLHAMMEQKKELENQKEQLKMQLEMIEREKEENKILLESLKEKWNKTVDKQQLRREKDNLSETRWKLDEKRKDTQKVLIEINKLLQILNAAAQRMSAR